VALNKQLFDEHFEVFVADTEESRKINFKIRYAVFCEESGMDNSELFPEQMEWDEADAYSVHFIVRNRYSGKWVAAMRLVQKNHADFPFAERCIPKSGIAKEQAMFDSVELSRCCVVKDGRQIETPSLAKNTFSGSNNVIHLKDFKLDGRSIILSLYRAAALYSSKNNIDSVNLFLTQAMVIYAMQQGFEMNLIGTPSQQRGERSLYKFNVNNFLKNISSAKDGVQDFYLYSAWINQSNLLRKIS